MKIKAEPCPFCGYEEHIRPMEQKGGHCLDLGNKTYTPVDGVKQAVCKNCGARGPESQYAKKMLIYDMWNCREEQITKEDIQLISPWLLKFPKPEQGLCPTMYFTGTVEKDAHYYTVIQRILKKAGVIDEDDT
jgi:hypothetical protein